MPQKRKLEPDCIAALKVCIDSGTSTESKAEISSFGARSSENRVGNRLKLDSGDSKVVVDFLRKMKIMNRLWYGFQRFRQSRTKVKTRKGKLLDSFRCPLSRVWFKDQA